MPFGGTSGLWVDGLVPMLAGRLVLGVGVARMMVLATTWAGDLWAGPAQGRFLGLQGAVMSSRSSEAWASYSCRAST